MSRLWTWEVSQIKGYQGMGKVMLIRHISIAYSVKLFFLPATQGLESWGISTSDDPEYVGLTITWVRWGGVTGQSTGKSKNSGLVEELCPKMSLTPSLSLSLISNVDIIGHGRRGRRTVRGTIPGATALDWPIVTKAMRNNNLCRHQTNHLDELLHSWFRRLDNYGTQD